MDQIKFQGYARERGFNPIQVSTSSVDAIAQQGNNLLRQMKENDAFEAKSRQGYMAGLRTAKDYEQQSREQNFQLRTQDLQNRQQAKERALEIENANFRRQQAALEQSATVLAPLAGLSQTIAKQVVDWQKQKNEAEMEQAYVDTLINGPDPQQAATVEAGLSQMRKSDELIQGTADKLQDTGAPPEAVRAVRKLSKWGEIGRAKAMAQMAGMEYGGWLEQQYATDTETTVEFLDPTTQQVIKITPQTAMGPDQKAAINKTLFRKFIKERGLIGINPTLIADALLTMKKDENQLLDKERVAYEKALNEDELEQVNFKLQAGLTTDPVTAINEALASYRHLTDENGARLSPLRAFNRVVDRLVGLGERQALEAFENSPSYMPGKTWGELRTVEFTEAYRKLDQQTAADEELKDRITDQEFENWSEERIQELYNSEEAIDESVVQAFIDQSRANFNGRVDERFEAYLANSTLQARSSQDQERELRELYERDELTQAEIDSGKYTKSVIDKGGWRQKAIDSDRLREQTNKPLRDQVRKSITAALIQAAGYEGENAVKAPSFFFAESHALRQLDTAAKTYAKTGKSPDEAYSLAAQDIVKRIQQDNLGEGKRQFGTYSFYDGEFSRWGAQGSGGQGGLSKARENVSSVINRVRSGGLAAITDKEKPLLKLEQVKATDDPNAPIPEIFQVIANNLPKGKSMSLFDIVDAQRNAHGLPPRQRPYQQQVVDQNVPSRLQELLNRTPTGLRTSRALTGSGLIGPGQERQAIQRIANSLGVDPVDVATFINYETSGSLVNGKYRRGLDIWGGDGGRYLGWIQFSPENQQKYGVRPGMNPIQMADAVAGYLKDSGIRPGDGLEAMYQAVQAPALLQRYRATGRLQGADSNGSVSGHVQRMKSEHRNSAAQWLAAGATSTWRDPRLLSSAARLRLGYDVRGRRTGMKLGKNSGIVVTSAVDKSGEPGSDFVVENGRRGADFYFPYQAKVVKVVRDQNWETNLEKGPGKRGYGNYVDLEVLLPNGQRADVRLAHFDAVNGQLRPGMRIPPGALIGKQGRTGSTTGAHVSADWYQPGSNTPHTDARDFFLQDYLRRPS